MAKPTGRSSRVGLPPSDGGYAPSGRRRRSLLSRWWFWLLLGVALQFVPWPTAWADLVYRDLIHPAWSNVTTSLNNALPLSLAAGLLLAGVTVLVIGLVNGWRGFRTAVRIVGWTLAIGALSYPLVFGMGYRTTTLETRLGLDTSWLTAPAAYQEAAGLVRQAVLATLSESAAQVAALAALPPPSESGEAAASRCLSAWLTTNDVWAGSSLPHRLKTAPRGLLLRFGSAGFVYPWFLEPHTDPALPQPAALGVALHEFAHAGGLAREAEAEAAGVLAGLACDDARVRYAASLRVASGLANELSPEDRATYLAAWPAGAEADLDAAAAVARQFRSERLTRAATDAYDFYLRSQGTEAGMADYDRALILIIAAL